MAERDRLSGYNSPYDRVGTPSWYILSIQISKHWTYENPLNIIVCFFTNTISILFHH